MASTLSDKDDANDTVIKRRTHVVVNSTERFFMASLIMMCIMKAMVLKCTYTRMINDIWCGGLCLCNRNAAALPRVPFINLVTRNVLID